MVKSDNNKIEKITTIITTKGGQKSKCQIKSSQQLSTTNVGRGYLFLFLYYNLFMILLGDKYIGAFLFPFFK